MDDTEQTQESSPIKRSFAINQDSELKYETKSSAKKLGKTILLVVGLAVMLLVGGFFLNKRFKATPVPVATPTPLPSSTSTPQPILNRSDWSFEVLNGTEVIGEAKKVADEIRALGYPVVKTANADKSNYSQTQILAKKDLLDGGASGTKIDLVIADLKDVIKIASVAGELTEGTASARIIIGKDSI